MRVTDSRAEIRNMHTDAPPCSCG